VDWYHSRSFNGGKPIPTDHATATSRGILIVKGPAPEGTRSFALMAAIASAQIDAMLLYSFVRE
jgi:hypothetical protein